MREVHLYLALRNERFNRVESEQHRLQVFKGE
jgi:hypothetical protein